MIGIYKITSPSNKVYIGSSNNINKRFNDYKNLRCHLQRKLYNSLIKYGWENHIFEIIEECLFEQLYIQERYWQEFYNAVEKGLNCDLVQTCELPKIRSKETIEKIRNSNIGRKMSKESREKMRQSALGKIISEETRIKMSNVRKGKPSPTLGLIHSEQSCKNMSLNNRSKEVSGRKVTCIITNKIWLSIGDCAKELGLTQPTLSRYLNGVRFNKTTIKFLEDE